MNKFDRLQIGDQNLLKVIVLILNLHHGLVISKDIFPFYFTFDGIAGPGTHLRIYNNRRKWTDCHFILYITFEENIADTL